MRTILIASLVAAASVGSDGSAQQSTTPKADPARVAKLIEGLDSALFAERERSSRELLAMEAAAFEPLRAALGKGRSVEFTRRAKAILEELEIYEPGGAIVNGLKIRLMADRDAVKMGDTVNLLTKLCNMTDKPLNVMVGYTTVGNYFECGCAVRRIAAPPGKPSAEVDAKMLVPGFCGTGAGPIYVTISAKRALHFTMPAVLVESSDKSVFHLGRNKYFGVEPTGGTDGWRMMLDCDVGSHEPRPKTPGVIGVGVRPTDEDAPFWTGKIRSNDVQIKLAK